MALSAEARQSLNRFSYRYLQQLPDELLIEMRATVVKNAEMLVEAEKSFCPTEHDEAHGHPPGALRDTIRYYLISKAKGLKAVIIAGNREIDYAKHVEHGTAHAPAHPWFFPVYRLLRKKIKRNFAPGITKVIKRFNAGVAK